MTERDDYEELYPARVGVLQDEKKWEVDSFAKRRQLIYRHTGRYQNKLNQTDNENETDTREEIDYQWLLILEALELRMIPSEY